MSDERLREGAEPHNPMVRQSSEMEERGFSLMEAVIATGGKQYRVAPGQVIKVERLGQPKGKAVEFTQVLLVNQDGQLTVEPKALAKAKVTGEVLEEKQGAKVLVVKFKRRKNYRRHRGHRQIMTAVRITKIEV
jgi:large subunit ribosomal protein L21